MKKIKKDIVGFTGVGVTLGIGAGVVGAAGGPTGGFAAMGSMMPIASTAIMGGHALRLAKNLTPKKSKKNKLY